MIGNPEITGEEDFKLLSEIGKSITSSLSVEVIIETAYESINKLMDASSFWIGIYNETTQRLDYPIGKENGKTFGYAFYDLSDDRYLPVWSFKNKKEIFINDYMEEYRNYIPGGTPPVPVAGDVPQSSIWIPLFSKDKKTIGILTIQSFKKFAYTNYHFNIAWNIAIFTSIALDNALQFAEVEQMVKKRTEEVIKQKEEIETAFRDIKLLSEMGNVITSLLSVEKIIKMLYNNVNYLMSVDVFGIGLLNESANRLEFPGTIENDRLLENHHYPLTEDFRLSVFCFKIGREILINDITKEYNDYIPGVELYQPKEGDITYSIIYLPLLDQRNNARGVITVQSYQKNAYTKYHLNLLKNLCIYTSIALENARAYESLNKATSLLEDKNREITEYSKRLSSLHEMDQAIISAETLKEIATASLRYLLEMLPQASRSSFIIYDNLNGLARIVAAESKVEISIDSGREFETGKMTSYPALVKGEAVLIDDVSKLDNPSETDKELLRQGLRGYAMFPVMYQGELIGSVNLAAVNPSPFNEKEQQIINEILNGLAIAISHFRLQEKINYQYEELKEKNKDITDSINYAKRIQEAILPSENTINKYLPNSFFLFLPKDILSGDFYYLNKIEDTMILAAIDCTGHGVPGAIVSVIGYNAINRAVKEFGISEPGKILDKVRELVAETFERNESDVKDGMDISLVSLAYSNESGEQSVVLKWAGANIPLWMIKKGELIELKADKQPIGKHINTKPFKTHTVYLEKGDSLYLFTDGYADQFGGPQGKKLKTARMKEMILSAQKHSMKEQEIFLKEAFYKWKGSLDQVDDVCVIGVRV